MLSLILSAVAAVLVASFGFSATRNFVRSRLKYVDAVNHPMAPLAAGVVAGLVGVTLAPIVPFVGIGTGIIFGASVGLGVASGAREIRRALPPGSEF